VIRAAAAGSPADRQELARRYLGTVRAYLAARWGGSALRDDLENATQEVFVECFRQDGAVEVAGASQVPAFRAFLYGVIRNVARRFESRPGHAASPLPEIAADDVSQSRLFERTWAQVIMNAAKTVTGAVSGSSTLTYARPAENKVTSSGASSMTHKD
jgi:DNA-directed RNA polymerase specialized sigma24 family protein